MYRPVINYSGLFLRLLLCVIYATISGKQHVSSQIVFLWRVCAIIHKTIIQLFGAHEEKLRV